MSGLTKMLGSGETKTIFHFSFTIFHFFNGPPRNAEAQKAQRREENGSSND